MCSITPVQQVTFTVHELQRLSMAAAGAQHCAGVQQRRDSLVRAAPAAQLRMHSSELLGPAATCQFVYEFIDSTM